MATKKAEVKKETKKYIAKAILVDKEGGTIHPNEEVEFTEEQAKRLLELDVIEAPEAE